MQTHSTDPSDLVMKAFSCLVNLHKEINFLKEENSILKNRLELSYINDNFQCYNRMGGTIKGNEFLQQEKRRVASGELVMLTIDVGGMGEANTKYGELAVNEVICNCLKEIRLWRGVAFMSQLNSGDEFIFIVDKADALGVLPKMNSLFRKAGFTRVYGVIDTISSDYITSANECMKLVYSLKTFAKQLSTVC